MSPERWWSANKAKMWTIISAVIGVLVGVIVFPNRRQQLHVHPVGLAMRTVHAIALNHSRVRDLAVFLGGLASAVVLHVVDPSGAPPFPSVLSIR